MFNIVFFNMVDFFQVFFILGSNLILIELNFSLELYDVP